MILKRVLGDAMPAGDWVYINAAALRKGAGGVSQGSGGGSAWVEIKPRLLVGQRLH